MYLLYGTLSYLLEGMQTIDKIQRRLGLSNLFHLSNNIPMTKDVQPEFTVSPT